MKKTAAILAVLMAALFTWTAQAQECAEETAKLLAADGMEEDQFGSQVSVSGDTVVIGASLDNNRRFDSGSAYVFLLSEGVWTQQAKLIAADGGSGDHFGSSVSISGDTAVIGVGSDDNNGTNSGSAYVFTRSEGVWTEQAQLRPADGAADDRFGVSVSIRGETTVIGANRDDDNGSDSGSAYVFTRSGDVWTEQAKLLPADGEAVDQFGRQVSLSGDMAVVGAQRDDDNGSASGSAYVFTRSEGVWIEQAKLLPADGEAVDQFGFSVSISGDTVVIGALGDDDNAINSGAAYVFTRSEGVWTEQAKLLPDDGERSDSFGAKVSLSGDTAVIGAPGDDDNGDGSGSAYVFTRSGSVWTEQAKLLPVDGAAEDSFSSVSVSGHTAVVGARRHDDNGGNSGSAYVFDLVPCESCTRNPVWLCDGDVDGDGQVNPVDSGLVQAAFGSTDEQDVCNYDVDCDGQINPVDSGIVQSLFGTCEEPRDVCP